MHDVDPKYCLPSHAHVTSKLVPLAREKALRAVTAQLDKAKFIALTIDIWTDRPMHSYFGVTAHSFISYESKSNLIYSGAKIAAEITKVIAWACRLLTLSFIILIFCFISHVMPLVTRLFNGSLI